MVFSHDFSDDEIDLKPSACIEVTMSDKKEKLEEDADKLRRIISYLEEKGISLSGNKRDCSHAQLYSRSEKVRIKRFWAILATKLLIPRGILMSLQNVLEHFP